MTVATIMTRIEEIDKLVSHYLELDADNNERVCVPYSELTTLCEYANEYKLFLLSKEVDLR